MTTAETAAPARPGEFFGWVNLAIAIVLLNIGNLSLDNLAKEQGAAIGLFFSPMFIVSIGCLGLAFFFYVRALARLALAVAYPVMVGLSIIVVAIANHFFGHTLLSPLQFLGIAVLFTGVVLISTSSRRT